MKRRKKQRITGIFFFCILMMGVLMPSIGRAETVKNVRVGIFPLGNFQNIDASGKPYGYNIDYLNKINEHTHWNIEYVPTKNWVEATALLESGAIDLLAPAQNITALTERFDYSVYTMGTEFAAIYTLDKRDDLIYEDFNTMSHLKYGAAENSTFTKEFMDNYAPAAGFVPNITYYSDTTALFNALNSGEVDAVVTNIMFASDHIKILGRFSPLPVYYIATKGNKALLGELNDAMSAIKVNVPGFEETLMQTYFPQYNNTQFTFSEYQYIESLPEVVVGYEVNHEPLSYTDEKTGDLGGITRSILDRVSEISGIRFKYVALPATDVTADYLKENQINVLSSVEYNKANTASKSMRLSTPYLKSEKVIVADKELIFDEDSELRMALATGSGTLESVVKAAYPNFSIQKYSTVEECFEAVRNGKADLLMQNRYVVERLLTKPIYENMTVLPVQSIDDSMCLSTIIYKDGDWAMNKTLSDERFISIMDKSINQITEKEINAIIVSNTAGKSYKLDFRDFAYQYRYFLVVLIFSIGVCLWLLNRARRIEELKNIELNEKNEQLSEAIGQAEKANSAKSSFLARMSHEIRTPMNAIIGITTLAKNHIYEPEKITAYFDKITLSSRVLLNIINDVLDMSAIESDKLKIGNSPFNFKELLTALSTMYYSQCRDSEISFDLILSEVSEEVLVGDALRINQILLNLLSNAFKFTPKGGFVKLTVTQTMLESEKVYMRFEVADSGCGMSTEMLERIFQPFEQENTSVAMKHGGSGLGMSITKNLVDMMDGQIKVESKKGVGSVFTVDLPFMRYIEEFQQAVIPYNDIRALVVDDDSDTREYTSVILSRIGVEHDIAQSGEEAVEILTEARKAGKKYAVCFVDWKMPGLTGIDVTHKIRELFDKDTMIIIVSAYDLNEVEDEARDAGADMFISKPMFQSTVFNVLMKLSGGKYTEHTAEVEDYDFSGKRVLLVEDNALNREIAVELLTLTGISVDCAENGEIALKRFETEPSGTYDVILMDVQMPVMDGHEAAARIRKSDHPDALSLPIYAMTANAFTEDITAALSVGMNGHIAKPIDTTILYETLKKCFEGQ